ncbi:heterokaryon incompatibility protein-domain-containing protein [Podospora aff. communis PSN243]|uniref:Heterokaryon incompatibility protein-domain-containing protein n=1 Tax=Podospora aff. communis PSN243 TaxID=3040156 RepID=A0AAV9GSE6_9PEZI|nr:heterokaryon incompatibility protein-domain-containing protein [Podospora aff. communis PSN243]
MSTFIYRPLDQTTQEFRLVDILPNTEFNSSLELVISHAAFAPPPEEIFKDNRPPLEEIQKTLPVDWYVDKTQEGRLLYEDDRGVTTWVHPRGLDFGDPPLCPPAGFEPSYEALSYAWGDPNNTEGVAVWLEEKKEASHHGSIQITRPLAVALRHLRYESEARTMWIDALCINQQDLVERSNQVARMRDIYRLAVRVVVWLGPAENYSNLAIRVLRTIGERSQFVTRDADVPFKPCPDHLVSPEAFNKITCGVQWTSWVEEAIYHLGGRAWFSRVWTIQEFQLGNQASVVQCGTATISQRCLRMACMRLLDPQLRAHDYRFRDRIAIMIRSIANLSLDTFSILLVRVSEKACTDSRDKIYGILGLLQGKTALDIRPDYTIPVADVYKTAMLQHANAVGRLALLDHCNIGTKLPHAPSWVPNWEVESDGMSIGETGYLAGGFSSSSWTQPDDSTLNVEGVRLGTVTAISPLLSTQKALVDFMRSAVYGGHANNPWIPNCTARHRDQFVYLFNSGQTRTFYPGTHLPLWRECQENFWDHMEEVPGTPCPERTPVDSQPPRIPPPRLFYGSDGRIGCGPAETEPGDVLAVFPGVPLPKILRQTVENSRAYQVIGSYRALRLGHAEALLGDVFLPYLPVFHRDDYLKPHPTFMDLEVAVGFTVEIVDDPRLEKLKPEWVVRRLRVLDGELNDGMPLFEFSNARTGEVRRTDPRMSVDALRDF